MSIDGYLEFTKNISTGAQPTAEELIELKASGKRVVLNLSPTNTPNYLEDESQVCLDNCLVYIHFPVDCSELYPWQYGYFKGIMDSINEKELFIHCGGNIKSSGMLYIYLVKEGIMSKEEAMDKLKSLGRHSDQWYEYFKTMEVL